MINEDFLKRSAKYFPDKCVVVDGDTRLSYLELYKRTNRLANALLKFGIEKGNKVAIVARNSHQYLETFYAVAKIGAILVPVNWRLKENELSYILNNSEAGTIIVGEEFYQTIHNIRLELQHLNDYIIIGKKQEGTEHYEMMLERSSDTAPQIKIDENEIVIQMYTSGTTGLPKGVLMSHKGILVTQLGQVLTTKPTSHFIHLHCGAFFHIALLFELELMAFGATIVVMREFNPKELLRLIQDEKINDLFIIPTMLNFILDEANKGSYDTSSLKNICYGGMPISPDLLAKTMKLFPCDFYQFFGSTEAGNVSILLPEDHLLEGNPDKGRRLQSTGRCDLFTELKIVNEEGSELPVGQAGEIVVKSESVIRGYWKLPELNEQLLKEEWFHTGDIGCVDEDGYLYIVDRKSDMIISGGENIYPAEIDHVITSHPAVQMAAVIGVPDEEWGEAVKAFVVLKEGEETTEEEIIAFCKERLAGYKKPKSVDFVESLPMTPAGKVLKKVLKEKYWTGKDRRVN